MIHRQLFFFRFVRILCSNVSISKSNDDDVSKSLSSFFKSKYDDGTNVASSSSTTRIFRCNQWRIVELTETNVFLLLSFSSHRCSYMFFSVFALRTYFKFHSSMSFIVHSAKFNCFCVLFLSYSRRNKETTIASLLLHMNLFVVSSSSSSSFHCS